MAIEPAQLAHLAKLARLQLDPAKESELARSLSGILDLADTLAAVNTNGVVPLAHPLDMQLRLRADEVIDRSDQREHYLRQAPASAGGYFLVPKVIE